MSRNERYLRFRRSTTIKLVGLTGLLLLVVSCFAAAEPLDKEDVMLIVLSEATARKKADTIRDRGISFSMSPAVANEFEEVGAGETVLCALWNARNQDTASLQKQMTRVPDEQ